MAALLNPRSKQLIQVLLTDSKIAEKVFENANDKEKYKICTIKDNGTIILGKTSYHWWNQLLNCQDKFPFESFALKVWDALADASEGLNKEAVTEGLSREVVMKSIRVREYDYVVNRLFDVWRHVAQHSEGYQKPNSPEGDTASSHDGKKVIISRNDGPRNIIINVNGDKKIIPFVDSIGDDLNLGLEFGITGVRKIY